MIFSKNLNILSILHNNTPKRNFPLKISLNLEKLLGFWKNSRIFFEKLKEIVEKLKSLPTEVGIDLRKKCPKKSLSINGDSLIFRKCSSNVQSKAKQKQKDGKIQCRSELTHIFAHGQG